MGTLGGSLLSSSGSLAMFTAIRRASSLVSNLAAERCPGSHSYLLRSRRTIELRSYIKPELGELQVGLARFVHVRVARPFETFVCHDTVLRSRLHGNAQPTPHGDLLPIVAAFGKRTRCWTRNTCKKAGPDALTSGPGRAPVAATSRTLRLLLPASYRACHLISR
jgi:hypothetical protein